MHSECYGNCENWQKTWQNTVICQSFFTANVFYRMVCKFIVAAQEGRSVIVNVHSGQDVELLCTVTPEGSGSVGWMINNNGPYKIQQLHNGIVTGYSINGNNLIIENIMMNDDRDGTEYQCVITEQDTTIILDESNRIFLFVTGE